MVEIAYFAIALLAALVVLAKWKRRRDTDVRLKRGLTNYVAGQKSFELPV